jgi:hypothetical protein
MQMGPSLGLGLKLGQGLSIVDVSSSRSRSVSAAGPGVRAAGPLQLVANASCATPVSNATLAAERAALLDLLIATVAPNSSCQLQAGLANVSTCRWIGVMCDACGRVTQLALSRCKLSGLLPDSLAALS